VSFLIDTNVISEVRKRSRCDAHVARWYASVGDEELYLSVLVLGEIRTGIELARAKDPDKARALETWLRGLEQQFSDRVFAIDRDVTDQWGRMRAVRPIPTVDGLLAATAKVHGLTLVTRNAPDVAGLGASVKNPFEP
jgi:predicted nucleic acid-binding protein